MSTETQDLNALEAAGAWTNENNGLGAEDDNCTYTTSGGAVSGEFSSNFSSVSGTIDGIEVTVLAHGDEADDMDIELIDSTSAWVKKTLTCPTGGTLCTDASDVTVGGAADKWTGTWTAAWITSTNFRLRATAEAVLGGSWVAFDRINITIYYTPAGPAPPAGITRSLRRRKKTFKPRITKRNIR